MGCAKCGENNTPPKGDWTGRVIEIKNPETLAYLKLVNVPASMGTEEDFPPKNGLYKNVILTYDLSENIYLYTSDGIPARLTGDLQSIRDAIEKLEEYAITETEARETKDADLQNQIDTIKAASDVVDVVANHAELEDYDTSSLTKDDIIKVLKDETQNNAITYYRWGNNTFTLIGLVGPYYTTTETDTLIKTEQTARESADTGLSARIDSLSSELSTERTARESGDSALTDKITAEQTAREQAFAKLTESITAETTARQTADSALQTKLNTETAERKTADSQIQSDLATETTERESADTTLQENIDAIKSSVEVEQSAREKADSDLDVKITTVSTSVSTEATARQTADSDLQTQITAVKATADAALTPDDIDYTVVSDFALNSTTSTTTIQIDSDRVNLKTGTTSAKEIPLPVASSTQAGVMNTATFNAVSDNTSNIKAIMNGAVAVSGMASDITQDEITTAWKTATGLTDLINRASVYDTTNQRVWTYYTNTGGWYATSNTTQVEIDPFTNTKAGTILGTASDGQVYAENNGTGSVYGWDALKGRVATLEGAGYITENDISTLRTSVSANTTSINNLSTNKADKSSLATVATSGSYNDLSNKPTIPAAITVDSALSATSTNPVQNKAINTALSGKQATLTTAQLAAANSGITSAKVATYDGYATTIAAKANSADLATVATTGSYTDLTDKPTIPTVNDATLTIQQDGTSVGTFTANSATDTTINLNTPVFTDSEWTALWA